MCSLEKFQTFLVLKEAKGIVYVTTHGPIRLPNLYNMSLRWICMLPIECVLLYMYTCRSAGFRIKTEVQCEDCYINAGVIFLNWNIPFAGDCCSSFTLSSVLSNSEDDKFYQNYIAGSWSLSTVISTYNGRWDNWIHWFHLSL